jgi:hypothetical protein
MIDKQFYRIVISSHNKIYGDVNNGKYQIDCSQFISSNPKKQYQFAVENFITGTLTETVLVNIPTLTQVNSYSTLTKSANYNVLMLSYNVYYTTINHNTIGRLLTNLDFLRNSIMEVQFTDLNGTLLTDMGEWAMGLVVWEVDQEKS